MAELNIIPYGKIVNNDIEYHPVNKRTPEGYICNYNTRYDLLERDGYKPVRYEYSTEITERKVEDKGDYILVTEPQEPEPEVSE